MKLSRVVLGSAVAVSLAGAGLMASPASAQNDCVTVFGGNISNDTSIFISADAGTSISDASGGSNNLATTSGGHGAEGSVDIASAGNGGVATSSANGGAVSAGDINSGGNAGNAISVGNTVCGPVAAAEVAAPVEEVAPVAEAPAEVVALPETGVGVGELNALFAVLASAGAAAASLGLRRR